MTRFPSSNSGGCFRNGAGWSWEAWLPSFYWSRPSLSVLPKRYDASSRLLLDLEGSEDLGLDQVVMPIGIDLDTKLQTQIRIVQSDTIATSVIKQLGLQNNPEFAGKQAVAPARDFDSLDLQNPRALTKACIGI